MSYQPTILVAGFVPFLGAERNPPTEAVQRLPDELLGCQIVKRELPVVWFECVHLLEAYIEEFRPRTVLSVGQGYPTPPVLIERIGINLCNGPDNTDEVDLYDEPIFPNGPTAYFSTAPYRAMHSRLKAEGIPVRYHFEAGQNQCNCVLYSALHFAATRYPGMTAGFLHVPMLPDAEKKIEGMALETVARAVFCCVEEAAKALRPPVRTLEQYREDL